MTVMKRSRKRKKSVNEIVFILACIILPIINWVVFYVGVNVSSVFMAFQDSYGNISLDNFARFVKEFAVEGSQLPMALKNTFITFAIQLVRFPFTVLVSYFIYKKIPFYNFYRITFFLPTIIFSVAIAMVFSRLTSPDGFIAQGIQQWLGLTEVPELLADSRFANYTLWAKMLWLGFPGNLIIWGGMFARIPEDVLESAKLDGVTWWTEFTKIIVPMTWPTIALQTVLLFCGLFNADAGVFLQTKGEYGTMTLATWLYVQVLGHTGAAYASNVFNYMSAVGLIITVIAVAISLSIRRITDNAFREVEY